MTRLQETRTVSAPQAAAFAYTADFSNIEGWDPGVARSSQRTDGAIGVGTQFDVVVSFGASEMPMVYTITTYEPPDRVVLSGVGKRLTAIDDIRFRATDAGTEIHYTADLEFKGFLKLLEPFLGSRLDAVGEKALDGLAAALGA